MFVKSGKFNKRLGSSSFLLFSAICGMAGSSVASASSEVDLAGVDPARASETLENIVGKEENEKISPAEFEDDVNIDKTKDSAREAAGANGERNLADVNSAVAETLEDIVGKIKDKEVNPAEFGDDASTNESEDTTDEENITEDEDEPEEDSQSEQNPEEADLGAKEAEDDGSTGPDNTGRRGVYLDGEEDPQEYVYISEKDKDKDLEEIDELMKDVSDGEKKMLKALKFLVPSAAGGAAVGAGTFLATHPEAREKVKNWLRFGPSSKDNGGSVPSEIIDEEELDKRTKQLEDGIDKLKDIESQPNNDENKENKGDEQNGQESGQGETNQQTDDVKDETQTQEAEDEQGKKDFYSFVNGKYEYRSNALRYLFGLTKELDRCADEAATEEEKRDYISVKDRLLGILFFTKDDRTLIGPRAAAIFKLIHFILLCYSLVRRCYEVYQEISFICFKYSVYKRISEQENLSSGLFDANLLFNKSENEEEIKLLDKINMEKEEKETKPHEINIEKGKQDKKILKKAGVHNKYGFLSAFKDVVVTLGLNGLWFCAETVVPVLSLVDAGMDAKDFAAGKIEDWRKKKEVEAEAEAEAEALALVGGKKNLKNVISIQRAWRERKQNQD